MTNQVKIVVDPSVSKSWVQIDAIRLIGSTIPKGKQNITAGGPVSPRGYMKASTSVDLIDSYRFESFENFCV